MQVLVALADDSLARQVADQLRDAGRHFRCHRAPTCDALVRNLAQYDYDCVITGPELPGRRGTQAIEAIRARNMDVPILFVYGDGDDLAGRAARTFVRTAPIHKNEVFLVPLADQLDQIFQQEATTKVATEQDARTAPPNAMGRFANEHHPITKGQLQRDDQAERIHTQLLNVIAHELGTPITPIVLGFDLLTSGQLGPLTPAQKRTLSTIQRNLTWLEATVRNMQDASKVEKEGIAVTVKDIEITQLLRRAVDSHAKTSRQAGHDIRLEVDGPAYVPVDQFRIAQVIDHMLDNAIRYSQGPNRIRVEGNATEREYVIKIIDEGRGLDEDQLLTIFYPLHQAHDAMEDTLAGAGLSLYLSRGIVEAHGGRIWAWSAGPGLGTTFTITLPLVAATTETSPKPSEQLHGADVQRQTP